MDRTPLVNQQQLHLAQAESPCCGLSATSPRLKSLFEQLISQ